MFAYYVVLSTHPVSAPTMEKATFSFSYPSLFLVFSLLLYYNGKEGKGFWIIGIFNI